MDRASPFTIDYRREVRAGLRDIAPIVVAAVPISLLFGAVAAAKGLSPSEVTVMSALVFAGGAQFAAIETWIHPAPVLTLAFATLLINARHVLMGARCRRRCRMSRIQKFLAFFFLTDEAWALSERRALDRAGDRRLLGRHGHRAVGELDVVLEARRVPRLVPRRSRAHRRGFRLHGPVHRPGRRLRPQPRDAGHGRRQRRRRGPGLSTSSARPGMWRRALSPASPPPTSPPRGGALMSLDTTTLLAILAMAVVTYFDAHRRPLRRRSPRAHGSRQGRLRCHSAGGACGRDRADCAHHRLGGGHRSRDHGVAATRLPLLATIAGGVVSVVCAAAVL